MTALTWMTRTLQQTAQRGRCRGRTGLTAAVPGARFLRRCGQGCCKCRPRPRRGLSGGSGCCRPKMTINDDQAGASPEEVAADPQPGIHCEELGPHPGVHGRQAVLLDDGDPSQRDEDS